MQTTPCPSYFFPGMKPSTHHSHKPSLTHKIPKHILGQIIGWNLLVSISNNTCSLVKAWLEHLVNTCKRH